jgi:hypothetical protein
MNVIILDTIAKILFRIKNKRTRHIVVVYIAKRKREKTSMFIII